MNKTKTKNLKFVAPKSIRMSDEVHKLLQLISKVEGVSLGTLLSNIGEVYAKKHHPEILNAIEEQTKGLKEARTQEVLEEIEKVK